MSTNQDPLIDAITLGVPTLLQLLDGLTAVLERFNPDQHEQLLAILQPEQVKLGKMQQTLKTASFPSHVARFGELLMEAITYADKAIQHIDHSAVDPMRILAASRAVCRAREALFPSATLLAPIHEFFLTQIKTPISASRQTGPTLNGAASFTKRTVEKPAEATVHSCPTRPGRIRGPLLSRCTAARAMDVTPSGIG